MIKNINFVSKFKKANLSSIIIFILSIFFISFKGLNYGIDFKGGTLIELRTDKSIKSFINKRLFKFNEFGRCKCKKIW